MNFSDAFMSSDIRKWMSLYDPTMVILYLSCFFFSCYHHLWCESLIAVVCLHCSWQSEITCQSVWVLLQRLLPWIFSAHEDSLLAAGALFSCYSCVFSEQMEQNGNWEIQQTAFYRMDRTCITQCFSKHFSF